MAKEFNIGNKISEDVVKVTVNEYGDYIMVNANDAGFVKKYGEFMKWLDDKEKEVTAKQEEYNEKYGNKEIISEDEEGNVTVDSDALVDIIGLWADLYSQAADRVEKIFGQNCLKKYFRTMYEINPDFIPDEECIVDFIEQISPVMGYAYTARQKRLTSKYNKNRKGRRNV